MTEEVRFFRRLSLYALLIGLVYWFVSYEWVGTTLLIVFAIGSGMTTVLLRAGSRGAGLAMGGPSQPTVAAGKDTAHMGAAGAVAAGATGPALGMADGGSLAPDGPFGDESAGSRRRRSRRSSSRWPSPLPRSASSSGPGSCWWPSFPWRWVRTAGSMRRAPSSMPSSGTLEPVSPDAPDRALSLPDRVAEIQDPQLRLGRVRTDAEPRAEGPRFCSFGGITPRGDRWSGRRRAPTHRRALEPGRARAEQALGLSLGDMLGDVLGVSGSAGSSAGQSMGSMRCPNRRRMCLPGRSAGRVA